MYYNVSTLSLTNTNMIKRTVPTPIAINAIFLLLLLLPVIFISIGRASASPLEAYCERQYQIYRF